MSQHTKPSKEALKWLKTATPYETGIIETVIPYKDNSGYEIRFNGGCTVIETKLPAEEILDKNVKIYGKRGYSIQGLTIGENVIYAYTDKEMDDRHEKYVDESNKKMKSEFNKNKDKLDLRYNELPCVFQQRIDRFRKNNPDFRWKYEAYEMMCCTEAVNLADHLETSEKIKEWADGNYDPEALTFKVSEGHSGNTIECSTFLANVYLDNPKMIPYVHGAMALLVGCKDYGCHGFGEEGEINKLMEAENA